MSITDNIPKDFADALSAHYHNGLSLFPSAGLSGGHIQIAWIHSSESPDESSLTSLIKSKTASQTVKVNGWLGRRYCSIHYSEWNHIPDVLNSILDLGHSISLISKFIHSTFKPGEKFSLITFEQHTIRALQDVINQPEIFTKYYIAEHLFHKESDFCPLLEYYNWITDEGRAFCRKMRQYFNVPDLDSDYGSLEYKFFEWPKYRDACAKYGILQASSWAKYTPKYPNGNIAVSQDFINQCINPQSSISEVEHSVQEAECENIGKESECMVCLENKPNTIVFPCMHQCVCMQCSTELEQTNNKSNCIKCRQEINLVGQISE